MLNHNFKEGFINSCQICGNKNIHLIIDLGFQPLADNIVDEECKDNPSLTFPIKIYFCNKCRLLQNNYIVSDDVLYNKSYHYRPGISKSIKNNLFGLAKKLIHLYKLNNNDLILDLGCNDGTLLSCFQELGFKNVLGVEPTNMHKFAKNIGIKTINSFFNFNCAKQIKKNYGFPKLIVTTNVFAHTGKLGDFIKGVKFLLDNTGVFVIENHFLLDVIKKLQFDSFYHEHLRTYSLKSLIKLLDMYKIRAINAYTSERYNGNIQVHFSKNKKRKVSSNIRVLLKKEKSFGLDNLKTYYNFSRKIENTYSKLLNFLDRNKNKNIIGKSFPARASVILNYFSFLKQRIRYIAEQPSSLKLNKYISGTSIKIISDNRLKKIKPDIIIIFAWHLFDEIKNKWKKKGLSNKTRYILLLPKLKIYK
jgi:hypothetical protein